MQSIPIKELVVGDIIDIHQGDRVAADCILIEEMNISVDQSLYKSTDVCVEKEQSVYYGQKDLEDNHTSNPDPFLLTESKIMTGQGKAVVCAVGNNTLLARMRNG